MISNYHWTIGWTIGRTARLGVLLLLALVLGGCNSGILTATPPSSSTGRPTSLSSPTARATSTNAVLPLTPIVRAILTPLPTSGVIPSATKPACTPLAVPSSLPYPGRVGQTWYAEEIVSGTVVAQETHREGNSNYQIITTYSLFRVDERVRGLPLDEILIAQRGGTLDGCTQKNSDRPLDRDERLLLFLGRYDTQASGPRPVIYYIMFGDNGMYNLAGNTAGTPTAQLIAESRQILSQPPPADLSNYWIIPLDRAPLAPLAQATPRR